MPTGRSHPSRKSGWEIESRRFIRRYQMRLCIFYPLSRNMLCVSIDRNWISNHFKSAEDLIPKDGLLASGMHSTSGPTTVPIYRSSIPFFVARSLENSIFQVFMWYRKWNWWRGVCWKGYVCVWWGIFNHFLTWYDCTQLLQQTYERYGWVLCWEWCCYSGHRFNFIKTCIQHMGKSHSSAGRPLSIIEKLSRRNNWEGNTQWPLNGAEKCMYHGVKLMLTSTEAMAPNQTKSRRKEDIIRLQKRREMAKRCRVSSR